MQPPWCLLCDRHRAGGLDEVVRGGGGGVVKEGLRGGGERSVGLRHEDEGTLDGVAALEDGLLGAGDAADRHSLGGVLALDCGEGGIADGIGVARDRLDDAAGGGQLLIELAGVLGAGDGLEAVARAAAGLTADAGDLARFAADLAPVGDLTGEDLGDLLDGEILDLLPALTMTAMPSRATTVSVRPPAFSSSLRAREARPMSALPLLAASMPAPEPVGS